MTALPKPHNKHMSKGKTTDEPFTKQRSEMDSSFHCSSSFINNMPSGRHFARTWLAVMPPGWTPSTLAPPATSIFQEPPPSKNNLFYIQAHVLRQILVASARGRGEIINPLLPALSPWIARPQNHPLYHSTIHLHNQIYKPGTTPHRCSRGTKRRNSAPNCAP